MNSIKESFILTLLVIFSSLICFGQTESSVKKNDTQSPSEKINLIVTDKEDNVVNNLTKEEISLFIDGKEETNFTLEKETIPLLFMISVDNSGSLRLLLDDMLKTTKSIIEQNKQKDLTALMRFVSTDKIQITEKFSSDKDYLYRKLDLFVVEGGQTALIDAIYKSVQIVAGQTGGETNYRRAVVVISDGEDRKSLYKQEQLTELLKKENVQVFFIGLTNELDKDGGFIGKSPRTKARDFIKKITQQSGGVAIILKKIEQLPEIATKINSYMRTQYILKFQLPDNEKKDVKIDIKLAKNSNRKNLDFHFPKDY